ncbi:hypothetical protein TNCT_6301 [Trichonephila clavata]|uniref:Uncharacterized protein n=1 Tax=Trichonephila clavata TaxID=2740835 RepID=A0A8X6LQ28_TRICU|nr:hypothetical protein TNCT_6301 [Trichonephila clavata]
MRTNTTLFFFIDSFRQSFITHLYKATDNLLQRIQKRSLFMTQQVRFSMTQILTNVHPERVHHTYPEQNDSGRGIGEGSEQHSQLSP